MSDPAGQVATWRKVLAAILDFLMVFFGGGYAIGLLTGNVTAEGFKLEGAPALLSPTARSSTAALRLPLPVTATPTALPRTRTMISRCCAFTARAG